MTVTFVKLPHHPIVGSRIQIVGTGGLPIGTLAVSVQSQGQMPLEEATENLARLVLGHLQLPSLPASIRGLLSAKMIWWRKDRDSYRAWTQGWPSDAFEVLNADEFTALQVVCGMFGVSLRDAEEEG
jgi:hypothetical protein